MTRRKLELDRIMFVLGLGTMLVGLLFLTMARRERKLIEQRGEVEVSADCEDLSTSPTPAPDLTEKPVFSIMNSPEDECFPRPDELADKNAK